MTLQETLRQAWDTFTSHAGLSPDGLRFSRSLKFAVFSGLGPEVRVELPEGVTREQLLEIRTSITRPSGLNLERP